MRRIKISAELERQIRARAPEALDSLVAILDEPAPTKPEPGITAARFVDAMGTGKIAAPSHGDSGSSWARLQKRLTTMKLTAADAQILGAWLDGQTWLAIVTLETLVNKLPEWHTRATAEMKRSAGYKRPQWAGEDE